MTSPVSVIDLTNGELDPAYRDTLNSLPLSMAWSDNETAGIAIAQADALEPGRLACTNAHLILLAKPWLAQERDIETLAELEIPVMPLLSFLPKLFPSGTLPVESPVYAECSASITGTDIREILLEQLAMLGLMGALFDGRESFISRNHSYTVQSGATVFSGTYNAKTMFIDAHVVGMTRRLEVDITGGPSAQPAIIRTTTPTSLIEPALQYESSARISWRIALGHVRNGSALPYGLQKLRTDFENCRSCCASRDSLRRNYVICEECMTLKVLFIGGTGQISLPCVRAAIEAGHQVTVFNRGIRGEPLPKGVELITGDTDDIHAYAKLANRDWHVVNQFLARTTDLVERDISLFAGRTGQYVFISSASVYHKTPFDGRLAETTRIGNPFWSYSQAKIRSEEMIRSAVDLPYTIVRPSHTVRTAMPTMLNEGDSVALRMLADKPVIVAGDGTSLWTLTRSEDLARPFVRLFGNPGALGEDFHITSDNGYTWDAIYSVIARALGVDIKIVHVPSDVLVRYHPEWQGPLFGDKTLTTLFDNTKIKMLAGDFACESDLEKVLAAPIRFLKKRLEAGIQKDPAIEALSDRIVGDIERLAR